MSLMDDFQSACARVEKKRVPDGEGGFIVSWMEGEEFSATITFSNSMEGRAAEKQGVTSLYTITTDKNTKLAYHDVLRRLKDGKVFRVTSDGDDVQTPDCASFQVAQVTAEEWVLT